MDGLQRIKEMKKQFEDAEEALDGTETLGGGDDRSDDDAEGVL